MKNAKILALAGFALLPACTGNVGLFTALDLRDRSLGYGAQSNRLAAMDGTVSDAIPTVGTATYRGGSGITIATLPSPTALQGETVIEVNFADRSLTGQVTDLFGLDRNRDLSLYSGDVAFTGGGFDAAPANTVTIDYSGTLRGGSDVITLDGTLPGFFRGTPIAGITFLEEDATADINGTTYGLVFGIAAD